MIILPRQARDKHRESTQKKMPFCRSQFDAFFENYNPIILKYAKLAQDSGAVRTRSLVTVAWPCGSNWVVVPYSNWVRGRPVLSSSLTNLGRRHCEQVDEYFLSHELMTCVKDAPGHYWAELLQESRKVFRGKLAVALNWSPFTATAPEIIPAWLGRCVTVSLFFSFLFLPTLLLFRQFYHGKR
jgi:hypothetical protein